ncbi:hypothetical protein V6000_005520 [Aspergillus fumigatus]|nr:hypothetical protein KXV80_005405 [Aspergillus fumigatus]
MAGDVTREQVTWLYEVVTGGKDKPFVSRATPRTAGGGLLESVLVKRSGSSTSGLSPGEVSRAGIQV